MRFVLSAAMLYCSLVMVGCSDLFGASPLAQPPKVWQPGWHDAGLNISQGEVDHGGITDIATASEWILACSVTGKLYLGKQGRLQWDALTLPDGDAAYSILGVDSVFLCGGKNKGVVWQFTPGKTNWTAILRKGLDSAKVSYLARQGNSVTAFVSALNSKQRYVMQNPDLFSSTQWTDNNSGWPFWSSCARAKTAGTVLFAATYDTGLWKQSVPGGAWTKIPDLVKLRLYTETGDYRPVTLRMPRALAFHNGNMYVGHLLGEGISRLTGVDTPWVLQQFDSASGVGTHLPMDVFALLSHGGRLFAAGDGPDNVLVQELGTEKWRYVLTNWCRDDYGTSEICDYSQILDMAGIGDTVYAAAGGKILKIALKDVP
jgi:hypothetical protein